MRNLILLLLVALSGCTGSANEDPEIINYDLQSIIEAQIQALDKLKPELEKRAFINSDSSFSVITPDSLGWANELDIFTHLDLNVPRYKGQFNIKDHADSVSNLYVRSFESIDPDKTDVRYLRVYYLDSITNVKRITGEVNSSNPLYKSTSRLSMEFDMFQDIPRLVQYTFSGVQKIILKDTVTLEVTGRLIY